MTEHEFRQMILRSNPRVVMMFFLTLVLTHLIAFFAGTLVP